MSDQEHQSTQALLSAAVEIPEHVVMRSFEGELIALNLRSGEYHGLNPVAARMFEAMGENSVVGDLIEPLMAEYGQSREVIETDLANLLRALSERDLVVIGELDG
jgi:hypothetical protein